MSDIKGKIAKKYALALLRSFQDESSTDIQKLSAVEQALHDIANYWQESADFRERFTRPTVLASEKEAALQEIGKFVSEQRGINPADYLGRFLVLVDENRRMHGIAEIASSFSEILRQLREELTVEVVSASELSGEEKSRLQGELKSAAGSNLSDIQWLVDEDLIGGLIIRSGDKEVDGSVRGALSAARTALMTR